MSTHESSPAITLPDSAVEPSGPIDATFATDLFGRVRELVDLAPELSSSYRNAQPFPHIALDNFLPSHLAEAIYQAFPGPPSNVWTKLPTEDQRGKWAAKEEGLFPQRMRQLIFELNSGSFLKFLERLTGIDDLIADSKVTGGGLHRSERGGKLSVHVDFSHHPSNGLNRRLNLLIYLNKDWKEEYGGHLELWRWGKDHRQAEARILPVFNRCAIFSTGPESYHGHPEPLASPEGVGRQSIALYYFTNGRPASEDVEHNTLFQSRPQDKVGLPTRLIRAASSGLVRDLMPPIVHRGLRRVWNRRFTSQEK